MIPGSNTVVSAVVTNTVNSLIVLIFFTQTT